MEIEKHDDGTPQEAAPQTEKKTGSKKPVIVYIMILFIAAFLLMALSFLMHQRSNTEALGQLQTSFNSTIEEIQASQEQILALEKEVSDLEKQLENAEDSIDQANAGAAGVQAELDAMEQLYCLMQKYAVGHYEDCLALIEEMESSGSADLLPTAPITTSNGAVTAPFIRFQQLKDATVQRLAEAAE